ncbi:hypothetical protein CLAIMM_08506 isoform 1, partial [Cladophialophora immunda]
MDRASANEDVRLCDGCRALHLDTRLLSGESYDRNLPESISLSPDRCSLCSIIDQRLTRHRSAPATYAAHGEDPKTVIPDTGVVFRREPSDRLDRFVRRLKIYLSWSLPRAPVAEFWPSSYPVPT